MLDETITVNFSTNADDPLGKNALAGQITLDKNGVKLNYQRRNAFRGGEISENKLQTLTLLYQEISEMKFYKGGFFRPSKLELITADAQKLATLPRLEIGKLLAIVAKDQEDAAEKAVKYFDYKKSETLLE